MRARNVARRRNFRRTFNSALLKAIEGPFFLRRGNLRRLTRWSSAWKRLRVGRLLKNSSANPAAVELYDKQGQILELHPFVSDMIGIACIELLQFSRPALILPARNPERPKPETLSFWKKNMVPGHQSDNRNADGSLSSRFRSKSECAQSLAGYRNLLSTGRHAAAGGET